MKYLKSYKLFESRVSNLKFNKQLRKKGAKTDVYNVIKRGNIIGQVKWSSRLRGYGFLPTPDIDKEIKEFVKELMRVRRKEKKISESKVNKKIYLKNLEKKRKKKLVRIKKFKDHRITDKPYKFNSTASSQVPGTGVMTQPPNISKLSI